ncbi:MAG: hypothetical protein K5984_00780 [Bacteroidales bacterium]|nr:hypothetical protein [Bacteroidales bacterium]
MEKTQNEILSQLKETLESLQSQLNEVKEKIETLEKEQETIIPMDPENPVDITLTEEDLSVVISESAPAAEEPKAEEAKAEEPKPEEPKVEDIPAVQALLGGDDILAPSKSVNESKKPKKAVIDVMSDKLKWKTDMAGTPVKNIISAISLNDRAQFINNLFKQDPLKFQETITKLNGMANLEEAEAYVTATFPDWNLHSEVVYRFMMAVRRKLR